MESPCPEVSSQRVGGRPQGSKCQASERGCPQGSEGPRPGSACPHLNELPFPSPKSPPSRFLHLCSCCLWADFKATGALPAASTSPCWASATPAVQAGHAVPMCPRGVMWDPWLSSQGGQRIVVPGIKQARFRGRWVLRGPEASAFRAAQPDLGRAALVSTRHRLRPDRVR